MTAPDGKPVSPFMIMDKNTWEDIVKWAGEEEESEVYVGDSRYPDLNDKFVYPGHPLVIAFLIVKEYPDLDTAIAVGREFPAALENSSIPGAGGNVYAAIEYLHLIVNGSVSWSEFLERVSDSWERCDSQKVRSPDRWSKGVEQASPLEQPLRDLLQTKWGCTIS